MAEIWKRWTVKTMTMKMSRMTMKSLAIRELSSPILAHKYSVRKSPSSMDLRSGESTHDPSMIP